MRMTSQRTETLAEAQALGYVAYNPGLHNAFFDWTEREKRPYIKIQREERCVSIDFIALDLVEFDERSLWKMATIFNAVTSKGVIWSTSPRYSYIRPLSRAKAHFVAQALVALYDQFQGRGVTYPPFPDPCNETADRLTQAERVRYLVSQMPRDGYLSGLWKRFCRACDWPCIELRKAPKGTMRLMMNTEPWRFAPEVRAAIETLAVRMQLESEQIQRQIPPCTVSSTHLSFSYPFSSAEAIPFVRALVRLLDQAGYFPAAPDWHDLS